MKDTFTCQSCFCRFGVPMRRAAPSTTTSMEDLARSPARSDGSADGPALGTYTRNSPVLGTFKNSSHGTYTRNSPVERCGSEDEQMSTTSDQSQGSIEDLVHRFKSAAAVKPHYSTPRNSGAHVPADEDWSMSPISRNQAMSAASSSESVGRPPLHGPAPLKPALIRPTGTFRIPQKKAERPNPQVPAGPLKSGAVKTGTGLPLASGRGIPTRIPATRLSSIPRPGASRLSTVKKT